MIKNENQLKRAKARLREVRSEIEQYQIEYTGIERDFLVIPLIDEEEELKADIDEYQQLKTLSFYEAVSEILSKPTLIDDIGELLAKLRIAAQLTQEELASRLGWEQPNLSRFESEYYSSQTIGKTVEFASELGVWLYVVPSLAELREKPFEIQFTTADYPKSEPDDTSAEFSEINVGDVFFTYSRTRKSISDTKVATTI